MPKVSHFKQNFLWYSTKACLLIYKESVRDAFKQPAQLHNPSKVHLKVVNIQFNIQIGGNKWESMIKSSYLLYKSFLKKYPLLECLCSKLAKGRTEHHLFFFSPLLPWCEIVWKGIAVCWREGCGYKRRLKYEKRVVCPLAAKRMEEPCKRLLVQQKVVLTHSHQKSQSSSLNVKSVLLNAWLGLWKRKGNSQMLKTKQEQECWEENQPWGLRPALRHPVSTVGKKSFSFRRLVSGAHKVGISIRNHWKCEQERICPEKGSVRKWVCLSFNSGWRGNGCPEKS